MARKPTIKPAAAPAVAPAASTTTPPDSAVFAQQQAKPGAPTAAIFVLALAIALPRVPEGTNGETPVFVEGAIQRFATPDGAQFDVVHVDGVLHAQPVVHPKEDTDGQA